jgi:MFS family permease
MPWRTLLASPNLWWIMAMYFLYCWTSFFYLSWLHTFLEKARGYSKEDLVALSWLPFVCGGVANLLGGLASDRLVRRVGLRWGRRWIGVAGLATAAVFTGATFFTQDKFLSVLFLALGYAGSDFMLPVAWAVCLDVGGRHAGAVSGAMNMAGQFAGFLTSVAFGYIVAATGSWDAPLVPMTVTAALAAAAWLRIDATKPLFAPVVALCVLAACVGGAGAAEPARPRGSNVVVEGSAEEGFRLLRDGRPFALLDVPDPNGVYRIDLAADDLELDDGSAVPITIAVSATAAEKEAEAAGTGDAFSTTMSNTAVSSTWEIDHVRLTVEGHTR